MTAGEPVAPPLYFRGKQADRGRGWGIDPFPEVSRRHTAPRRGNRQGKAFAKSMERRDPSGWANASWGHTRVPPEARAGHWPLHRRFPLPPCRPSSREQAGKGICKIHGEAGSQWFGKCILGSHTGAARGGGGALTPSPTFPAAAIPLRIEGTAFAKSMERRDPSGLANALWGHTRGPQGAGWGLGPLTWASRHRRGGLPIRSSEGGRPHMGQEGI